MRCDHRGFTLMEVVIALTVGAVVVLVGHQVFAAVAVQGKTLTAARTMLDREGNARRWLTATFLSIDVGTEGASGFDGRPDHTTFTTSLLTPDGWFERRVVSLTRQDDRFLATATPGQAITLADSVRDIAFDYLLEPGAESRWVREWVSPVSAPVALRLRISRSGKGEGGETGIDTLLFLIKERG